VRCWTWGAGGQGEVYLAMGSGVTPNQTSSVIQMPESYLDQMLWRWCQYLMGILVSVLGWLVGNGDATFVFVRASHQIHRSGVRLLA